jgi:hypothetical protein
MSLDIGLMLQVEADPMGVACRGYLYPYSANCTHNLSAMWNKAGCWGALYESEGRQAWQILEALEQAIEDLRAKPLEYEALNPKNGWGCYAEALQWIEKLAEACRLYPHATIWVQR